MFPLSWPESLFQCWVNAIALVFLRSLPESNMDQIPPIFPLLPSPKLDRKLQELPYTWNLILASWSNRGEAGEPCVHCSVQCGILCTFYMKKIYLMKHSKEKYDHFPLFYVVSLWLERLQTLESCSISAPKHYCLSLSQNSVPVWNDAPETADTLLNHTLQLVLKNHYQTSKPADLEIP